MARLGLNIKKKKNQFESVEFVNDMSEFQLKVLVKRLFDNFSDLANVLDSKDKKISSIIDTILDGNTWKEIEAGERFAYVYYGGETIVYDTADSKFMVQHNDKTISSFDSMNKNEINTLYKKIMKNRKKTKKV